MVRPARLPGLSGVALGWARLPWHPAAGLALPAVARALRRGLATVRRARLAGGMRGAPRPVSGSGP